MAAIVRPESLGGDHGPARTLATARTPLESRSHSAYSAAYWAVFKQHRESMLVARARREAIVVDLPGLQRRKLLRDLTYRQILDVAHRRAERAVQRSMADYRLHGEQRGKQRAGEAL